ncbi:MAG TPA: metal-dependent transcriptional regulator [Acholeplasmataceae bacterium]|jgi:Mn-dependent DtxR family transcriptional regulator|nr:metal-dependent transcriptional regulator [Acholeplasmataceae bacterium]
MKRTTESREDYLETIFILGKRHKNVRSIDIARELGYSKPSISRAMGILKKSGFINIDKNGYITLTELGLKRAQEIFERHSTITNFLIHLGVDEEIAEIDACRIEHIISEETFEKIKAKVENENYKGCIN